jgi:hypothetical protein
MAQRIAAGACHGRKAEGNGGAMGREQARGAGLPGGHPDVLSQAWRESELVAHVDKTGAWDVTWARGTGMEGGVR